MTEHEAKAVQGLPTGHDSTPESVPKVDGRCNAWIGDRHKRCALAAGWGTDHVGIGSCRLHLGATPNHRRAAQTIIAREMMVTYGLPQETTAHEAIQNLIEMTWGHVVWLAREIAEHESLEDESMPALLSLYSAERRLLAAVSRDAIACGLMERQVRLQEDQAQLIARAIDGILTDLGVRQMKEVPGVVRKHLMLVSAKAS